MNLLDLFIKVSVDDSGVESGFDKTKKEAEETGSKLSKVASGVATLGKVGAVAIGATATAVSALTKQSTEAYADYQQLVGGVETLYGSTYKSVEEYAKGTGMSLKEAEKSFDEYQKRQQTVMDNASKAYMTAGLSANEYMETVTGFAAALNASLGKNASQSAKYADMAVGDMADNANKMGTSIESIQTAYAGFSKQNFTMLDNLKLGYGGTKEEMERLLRDAEKLQGLKVGSLDTNNFADIVSAIHTIQDDLGIYGTTAKEASQTISGSLASMKGAWTNLVAGLANPDADLGLLITNVVNTAETALQNLLPAVETALGGIANLIANMAPIIAEKFPALVEQILPPLLKAAMQIITALVDNLPALIQILVDQAPMIIETLIDALISLLPEIINLGFDVIMALADGIINSLDTLVPAIIDIVLLIVDKLTDPDTIVKLLDASLKIMVALAEGLMNALPKLIDKVPQIIQNLVTALVNALPKIAEAGLKILESIIGGILKGLPKIPSAIDQIKTSITNGILNIVNSASTWGRDLIQNFINGIRQKFADFKSEMANMASTVKSYIGFSEPEVGPLSNFHTFAPDMMELFAKGIRDNTKLITDQISKSFDFEDAITAGADMTGTNAVSSGSTYNNAPVINVYGAEGQDVRQLAEIVADTINNQYKRQSYAWGGV